MQNRYLQKAKWIWTTDFTTINQYADFRLPFCLPEVFSRVQLLISADSHYAACVNGQMVPASQYADYPAYKVYDSVDITDMLHSGENVLTVIGYCQNEDSSVYRCGKPGILFAVEADDVLIAASDTETLCRPSPDYQSGNMEKFSGQLSFSFRYNADRYDGWQEPAYIPAEGWQKATETGVDLPLYPRPIKPLEMRSPRTATLLSQGVFFDTVSADSPCGDRMQRAALAFRELQELSGVKPPQTVPHKAGLHLTAKEGNGVYLVLDLGAEEAGYAYLDVELSKPAEIIWGFGEHLDDLRVRSSVGGRQFAAVYHARAGRQTFLHRFKRCGCRYVQLHMYADEVTMYYAGVRPTPYPVVYKPAFRCADELHNRIFEVSRRTLELCMHEHYEDCPWREQALYAMDSRNQMLCGYYTFECAAFAQSSLRLLALGQREDGLLELCAPARVGVTIPAFSLSFITAVYENVLFSGDTDFGHEMLPTIERILRLFVSRIHDNGLVPCFTEPGLWNFYEWKEGLDGGPIFREEEISTTYDAPLNGFLSLAFADASRLYGLLGDAENSQQYAAAAHALNLALRAFWIKDKQVFASFITENGLCHECELTQALLICAGAADEKQIDQVLPKLASPDGSLIPTTLSCSIFKYDALMRRADRYAADVIEEIARVWGKMLFNGATSFWETDLGAWDFDNAGSLCHGWSAIPIYVYYRYVLGEYPVPAEHTPVFYGLHDARTEA